MKWVNVEEYLPPIGVDVLCFRPSALEDSTDKPLRICHRTHDGAFSGSYEVTQWLDMDVPEGWTNECGKRQHS
jgi:hypothetical protein